MKKRYLPQIVPSLCILGGIPYFTTPKASTLTQRSIHTQTGLTRNIANSMQQSCHTKDACGKEISSGCTVFTVSKGDQVFFGGNDDLVNSDSYYWVDPGNAGNYGAIWIGTRDNVQQGVNEKGLAYDPNGLPRLDVNPHRERESVPGGYSNYPIRILHECATVEEVIGFRVIVPGASCKLMQWNRLKARKSTKPAGFRGGTCVHGLSGFGADLL